MPPRIGDQDAAFALALIIGGAVWARPVQAQTTADPLTGEEIDGLLYMIEEEKLARDEYLMLDGQWDLRVFQNISRAEQTHMDAVASVLTLYNLDIPVSENVIGDFTNPELQTLYDELFATGSQSIADALRVGIAIEEIDILDLKEYVDDTDEAGIRQLYTNLLQGPAIICVPLSSIWSGKRVRRFNPSTWTRRHMTKS